MAHLYRAFVYSIPGSGTRFVMRMLEKCFGYRLTQKQINTPRDSFRQIHVSVDDHFAARSKELKAGIIVPLRNPYHTYLTRYYRTSSPYPEQWMAGLWRTLIENEAMNALYFPMGAGLDRAMLLQTVAKHLQAEPIPTAVEKLIGGWQKEGTVGERPTRDVFDATGLIDGKKPEFLDFAVEWYEEIVQSIGI